MRKIIFMIVAITLLTVPGLKVSVFSKDTQTYLIISVTGSANLEELIKYRKSQGFDVVVKDSSEFADKSGKVSPILIINHLKANKVRENIKYLLLVGYHYELPMALCHPEGEKNGDQYLVSTPTDYPYATPSAPWDKDGDGKLGEWPDEGICAFEPEISVGRFPFSDPVKIARAVKGTIEFDTLSDSQKSKILFGGAMLGYKGEIWEGKTLERTDGGYYCEAVWNDAFAGKGFSRYRMYEKEGFLPSPYECEEGLTSSTLTDKLTDRYGLVLWTGHGSSESVVRTVWHGSPSRPVPDKGDTAQPKLITTGNIQTSSVKWGIVLAASCSTSDPSNTGNLGATFVGSGAAGYIGSSRVSWSPSYWRKPEDGGMDTILHSFCKFMSIPGMTQGMALSLARREFGLKYFYGDVEDPVAASQMNIFNFNLYGDPAVTLVKGDSTPSISIEDPSIISYPESQAAWSGAAYGSFDNSVRLQVLPSQRDMAWALPEIAVNNKSVTVTAEIPKDVDLGKRTWFIRMSIGDKVSMIPLILNIASRDESRISFRTTPCKIGKKSPFELELTVPVSLRVYEFVVKYDPFDLTLTGVKHLSKTFTKVEIVDNHFGMAFIRAEGNFRNGLFKIQFKASKDFAGKNIEVSSSRLQNDRSSLLITHPTSIPLVVDEMTDWRLEADFNDSGTVDGSDLFMIMQNLGKRLDPKNKSMDLNHDGKINIIDAFGVRARYSPEC